MALLDRIKGLLRPFLVRFERQSIKDKASLVAFLHTRSAYVAQTALFGYLKTRMGTQYREIFQDPVFAEPLAKAQRQVFLDCLADVTIFAISFAIGQRVEAVHCASVAIICFENGARAALPEGSDEIIAIAGRDFAERVRGIDWKSAAEGEAAFTQSPPGLVQAAPVIEGYKDLDKDIVMNSIRFRWTDVRRQLRDRIDAPSLAEDLADLPERSIEPE